MTTLGEIGELQTIERLAAMIGRGTRMVQGPGDDCAVFRGGSMDWLLTSDPVIQGVHFDVSASMEAVGRKAVGRVLSDVAAMGGDPQVVLVDLVAPAQTPLDAIESLYAGMLELARRHECEIGGGDVAEGSPLQVHVFGLGSVPTGRAVLRSGARPGDALYVTGHLGGSRSGRHLAFDPRLREGRWLRQHAGPSAMIDLSDGLATDLRHVLTASGCGAELWLDRIPVSEAARASAGERTPLEHALYDGEDFELLLTVPAESTAWLQDWRRQFDLPCSEIGRIVKGVDQIVGLDGHGARQEIGGAGFQHFRQGNGASIREEPS